MLCIVTYFYDLFVYMYISLQSLCMAISHIDGPEMEFDWEHIYLGFANAIRRILLSEVLMISFVYYAT